jgi:hypothetical protein
MTQKKQIVNEAYQPAKKDGSEAGYHTDNDRNEREGKETAARRRLLHSRGPLSLPLDTVYLPLPAVGAMLNAVGSASRPTAPNVPYPVLKFLGGVVNLIE